MAVLGNTNFWSLTASPEPFSSSYFIFVNLNFRISTMGIIIVTHKAGVRIKWSNPWRFDTFLDTSVYFIHVHYCDYNCPMSFRKEAFPSGEEANACTRRSVKKLWHGPDHSPPSVSTAPVPGEPPGSCGTNLQKKIWRTQIWWKKNMRQHIQRLSSKNFIKQITKLVCLRPPSTKERNHNLTYTQKHIGT